MLKNTQNGYGLISILMHWLMALMVFFLFGLGLYMVELTYYDAWYKGSLDLHKSLGITLLFLWLARVIWRWFSIRPKGVGTSLEQQIAHWAHLMLYGLMLAIMVSGYLISTADGRAIEVFGLFSIPALPVSMDQQESVLGDIHQWLAYGLMLLVGGHALAAVKHQFIDKDNTLERMIKPSK